MGGGAEKGEQVCPGAEEARAGGKVRPPPTGGLQVLSLCRLWCGLWAGGLSSRELHGYHQACGLRMEMTPLGGGGMGPL